MTKKFQEINNHKNSILNFIPLTYDVVLKPKIKTNENVPLKTKVNYLDANLNMKIQVAVKLYCNYSTDIVLVYTKEFSNIDLKYF